MTRTLLAIVVVFGSLYPASAQSFDPFTAYLAWDFSSTELTVDQTQPCVPNVDPSKPAQCVDVLWTPTPADAEALTYKLELNESPTPLGPLTQSTTVVTGVRCTEAGCRTPALAVILPATVKGGDFAVRLNRAGLPVRAESTWSNLVAFAVDGQAPVDPPPPPPPPPPTGATTSPDCTLGPTIVDASERTWTLVNNETRRDGIAIGVPPGRGTTYLWANQTVYVLGESTFWYRWTGSIWGRVGLDKPACSGGSPPPPPPPPPPAGETLKQQIQKALDDLSALIKTLP